MTKFKTVGELVKEGWHFNTFYYFSPQPVTEVFVSNDKIQYKFFIENIRSYEEALELLKDQLVVVGD